MAILARLFKVAITHLDLKSAGESHAELSWQRQAPVIKDQGRGEERLMRHTRALLEEPGSQERGTVFCLTMYNCMIVCVNLSTHTHTHAGTCTHSHTQMHLHMQAPVLTHTDTHRYSHTHAHICTGATQKHMDMDTHT